MVSAVSLFAGVGGFDLALERAGIEVTHTVEIDAHARGVLQHHWPNTTHLTDITKVGPHDLGTPHIVCGGFPCQSYSIAGNRRGMGGDERGQLWWDMHRVIADHKPRWVVGENVPGLLSSHGGDDFGAVVGSLVELGYSVAWRVLNSQHFGVAQRRRRVFIVAHLGGGTDPSEILFEPEGGSRDTAPRRPAGQDVAGTLGGGSGSRGWAADTERMTFIPDPYVMYQGGKYPGDTQKWRADDKALTSNTTNNNGESRPSLAVTSPVGVRRLLPVEAERLQGFPDGFTKHRHDPEKGTVEQADSARYRQMGNAVTVPVVEWIMRRIKEQT